MGVKGQGQGREEKADQSSGLLARPVPNERSKYSSGTAQCELLTRMRTTDEQPPVCYGSHVTTRSGN